MRTIVGAGLGVILMATAMGQPLHGANGSDQGSDQRAGSSMRMAGTSNPLPVDRARQGTIEGVVMDEESGEPLGGAQVGIPAADLNTVAGADGTFTLEDTPTGEVELVVDLVGYAEHTETVTVADGETVTVEIALATEALALDEIVATGTPGEAQRRAVGNVVSQVRVEDIRETSPARNIQEVLSGRVPGLSVDPGGGQVGASGAPIRIRGSSSLALSQDPIVYIDGVRMNANPVSGNPTGSRDGRQSRLNDINPDDIRDIEVISGPAASTLFGSEASNGVIQILTHSGAEQDTEFNASVTLGGSWHHDLENRLWDQFGRDADGNIIQFDGGNILTHERMNGLGDPFQTGLNQEYRINARGGSDTFRYFASFSREDSDGTVDWNWDENTRARVNLDLSPWDDLDIGVNTSFLRGKTRQTGQWFASIMWAGPEALDTPARGFNAPPPEALRDDHQVLSGTDRSQLSTSINYRPLAWLSIEGNAGVDRTDLNNESLWRVEPNNFFGANSGGRKDATQIRTEVRSFDAHARASYALSPRLGASSTIGGEIFEEETWTTFSRGDGFAGPDLTTVNAAATSQAGESFVENVQVGAFVQQEFDWENRIFFTAGLRVDDNSAFGDRASEQFFPKFSGTWVISEEGFFNVAHVDQLRLRAAWGRAGTQPAAFAADRLFTTVSGPGDRPVFTPDQFGNPDLVNERGSELEGGFDLSMFGGRLSSEFTGFFKRTTDAIVNEALAPSGGFPGSRLVNVGEVENYGVEVAAQGLVHEDERFSWDLGGSLSIQRNEINDLGPDVESISTPGVVGGNREHREGFPLAGWFAPRVVDAEFVEGNSGPVTNIMCDGGTGPDGVRQGGDPVPCGEAPNVFWGESEPTWLVSANTTVGIGPFDLTAVADGRGGHIVMDNTINAASTSFTNTELSQTQDDPIFMGQQTVQRAPIGFHSGSFVKLRELSLRYSIPQGFVDRVGVTSASVNLAFRNVWTMWQEDEEHFMSRERVLDPEIARPAQTFQGEQQATPPPVKTFDATIRVSF